MFYLRPTQAFNLSGFGIQKLDLSMYLSLFGGWPHIKIATIFMPGQEIQQIVKMK
jgi:hypothetical protein